MHVLICSYVCVFMSICMCLCVCAYVYICTCVCLSVVVYTCTFCGGSKLILGVFCNCFPFCINWIIVSFWTLGLPVLVFWFSDLKIQDVCLCLQDAQIPNCHQCSLSGFCVNSEAANLHLPSLNGNRFILQPLPHSINLVLTTRWHFMLFPLLLCVHNSFLLKEERGLTWLKPC